MEEAAATVARVDIPSRQPARTLGDEAAAGSVAAVPTPRTLRRRGFVSRLWKGLFGAGDNIEKFLQQLSKEEAAVHSRLKRRTISFQRTSRHVIAVSVLLEVLAVAYAIVTTRGMDLSWHIKAARLLPIFLLPGLSAIVYSSLTSFARMLDSKDQKTLERLRAERQAKIDELKERTNYYSTQQIIQKYDLDPAAKAAAATVLASKLGVESGLKVYLGDDPETNTQLGRNYDLELTPQTGLCNRKPSQANGRNLGHSLSTRFPDESNKEYNSDCMELHSPKQRLTENSFGHNNGGWLARVAALLVGEDPTQCYALICRNCYMHNGLCRKEDLPYLTYYCPHCHALNGPRHPEDSESGSVSGNYTPTSVMDGGNSIGDESTASPTMTSLCTGLPALYEQPREGEKEIHELAI